MKIIVISNRLPVTVEILNGEVVLKESVGGLISGISAYLDSIKSLPTDEMQYKWIGWPGSSIIEKYQREVLEKVKQRNIVPVFINEKLMDKFYNGFCNKTIWPLFHYFSEFTAYNNEMWKTYEMVNEIFCDVVSKNVEEGDILWIHDYHLMLLPGMLRKLMPNAKISFFLHIPFPHFEIFRLMPPLWRKEIINGLLGADLIGFHIYEYTKYFLGCVLRISGHENNLGEIQLTDRIVKTETFPMGIDFNSFEKLNNSAEVKSEREKLKANIKDNKIVLSIDRLDYSKGIINRLEGYEIFLRDNPEWRGQVTLLTVVVPSRIGVDRYHYMKREIDETIGKINGLYGTLNWTPIIYQYKYLPMNDLVATYNISDVALITPLRDGMNLIAKEYVASRLDNKGVLILSEMAGASKELGEALIINPNHIESIAAAIKTALEMKEEEQISRNKIIRNRLKTYDIFQWANDMLTTLMYIKNKQITFDKKLFDNNIKELLLKDFRNAKERIIFLDYDGTLVPFTGIPQQAFPDNNLIEILKNISSLPGVHLVIVSGRDQQTLETWFQSVKANLIAEHGVYIKERTKKWRMTRKIDNKWKMQIKPVLFRYSDLLPGSFVEEKSNTLGWHYRKADPEHAEIIKNELVDNLYNLVTNMNLQVTTGSKVVEIRNIDINKGTAVMDFISDKNYDFILSIGDDWTDEDMFKVMPDYAYTIKVGMMKSYSRYNVYNQNDVRNLLIELTNV